jgi:DNA-cytosine methyltransferase
MRHGSLFSGIGGFDLAAEWMGWENIFHCEWMEFPRKVLDYHFPDADSHIDICKTDFKKYANKIDILTGGFPCQPFSLAGKRKGTDDERYLWGEMLRAIQEIKPRFVIAENVFGITNIDGGLVFEQVCVDLENEGYEVQPFIIPAAAKNAPHRRDRCWFIGFRNASDNYGIIRGEGREFESAEQSRHGESDENSNTKINGIIANAKNNGQSPTKTIDKWGEYKSHDRYKIRDTSHTNGTSRDVTNTKCNGLEHGNKAGNIRGEKTKTFGKRGESTNVFEANGCDATNPNCDGFGKQWRYDGSRQNDARCNSPFKRSANSKNIDNGDTSTNLVGQSTIDARIGEQANVETNQFATAEGICRLDTECDQFKGIVKLDRCETLNGGTLVQDGCEGIQSPQHRGMDKDCRDISSDGTNECKNDGTIINRMDGDVANANGNGLNQRNGNDEVNTSQRGEYALGDINTSNVNGYATDTTSTRGRKDNRIGKPRFNDQKSSPNNWNNFPTQSPVCGGDDGISTELDGITFSKWRAESIKGYGNAIVPQIAYSLFQIINEL